MYFVTLGFAFAVKPVSNDNRRTYLATLCFAISAIVGWPFSVVLAVPFVIEELFVVGLQAVPEGQGAVWARARFQRLFLAGMLGLLTLVSVLRRPLCSVRRQVA
jgi:alpha-1,2-mannosyltransferase